MLGRLDHLKRTTVLRHRDDLAEPDLMPSVPVIRALNDGLSPNVVPCAKPHWWPL